MAEFSQSYKEKVALEKQYTKEATEKYDELLSVLILIATLDRSKSDKLKLISEQEIKMKNFNKSFSQKSIEKVYKLFSKEALSDIGIAKKSISTSQEKELSNLVNQLEVELNKRLDGYVNNARKLTLKKELEKLREEVLKFENAEEKRVLKNGKQKEEIIFMDSKGRRITNSAVMKITVGDSVWDAIYSSKRTTFLKYGFRYGIHKSVIDEKTTDICLSLDGKIRDLTKDKIPPMHPGCRSDIILLKDKK